MISHLETVSFPQFNFLVFFLYFSRLFLLKPAEPLPVISTERTKWVRSKIIFKKPFFSCQLISSVELPRRLSGYESTCQCRRHGKLGFDPWVGKIPWRRKWQPTPVFLLGKSQGQRSLMGYSPWGCKESDVTDRLSMHVHF